MDKMIMAPVYIVFIVYVMKNDGKWYCLIDYPAIAIIILKMALLQPIFATLPNFL